MYRARIALFDGHIGIRWAWCTCDGSILVDGLECTINPIHGPGVHPCIRTMAGVDRLAILGVGKHPLLGVKGAILGRKGLSAAILVVPDQNGSRRYLLRIGGAEPLGVVCTIVPDGAYLRVVEQRSAVESGGWGTTATGAA